MKRKWMSRLGWLTVVLSVMVMSGLFPVAAQEEQEEAKEKQWGVRLGVWYPTDPDVRDFTKDWWIYFGLEHYLRKAKEEETTSSVKGTSVSLDYTRGSGKASVLGVSVKTSSDVYSLFYNFRGGKSSTEWLAGLGIIFTRVKATGTEPYTGQSYSESETKTDFGLTLGVVQKFGANTELQLRYHTGFRDANTGLVLNLGFRF